MPNVRVSAFDGRPLFDIASYAKRGPGRDRLSPAELAQISRTVRRAPEAVVKVLTRNSNTLSAVARHLDYLGRKGELDLETDQGETMGGKEIGKALLEDWDLDLDEHRRQTDLKPTAARSPPKLVHKLMLSMPPGTPTEAVRAAARNFLREEFALKHRYAFVLHTDEPHPHVHAVVKAVSEQGIRLHIRKATLRQWRSEFARQLREQGVEANATERAVRGVSRTSKRDGVYRAGQRRASSYMRARIEEVAKEVVLGQRAPEPSKKVLVQTRRSVYSGWQAISDRLLDEGRQDLGQLVRYFTGQWSQPQTDKEQLAAQLEGVIESRLATDRTRSK
ncbi:MAG: hypothetical protein CMLOHMNK_01815 [Steroidobacteraceae bacterium]|nr:hypothetical protein [Steroidobacteraceae bacterium]